MKKIIYLHVGLHKTGTSSIQKTLTNKKNEKILINYGYHYLNSLLPNHGPQLYSAFCDHPENFHINIVENFSQEEIVKKNQGIRKNLIDEINASSLHNIIISGEALSLLTEENVLALKQFLIENVESLDRIIVIISVRNPVAFSISDIQQGVKMEFGTFEHELEFRYSNIRTLFRDRVQPYINVYDDVRLYKFEEAAEYKHGLVGYFLKMISFPEHDIEKIKIIRFNEGISGEALDLISYINSKLPLYSGREIREGRQYGDTWKLRGIPGNKFDLPLDLKIKLYEFAIDDLNWLHKATGLDYHQTPKDSSYKKIRITSEYITYVEQIFLHLPITIKKLIIQYLSTKIRKDEIDYPEIITVSQKFEDLQKITTILSKFRNKLGIDDKVSDVDVIVKISEILISLGSLQAANEFISKVSTKGNEYVDNWFEVDESSSLLDLLEEQSRAILERYKEPFYKKFARLFRLSFQILRRLIIKFLDRIFWE